MHYLLWLDPVIGTRIEAGTIGPVVFVRAHLELTADHGLLARTAAAGLESAGRWVRSEPKSVYVQGGPKAGYLNLTVEFVNGACALLCAEAAHSEPAVQLLLVGRNGTLRYDDFPQPEQLRDAPAPAQASIAWIEEAVRSGKPVARGGR
ncbi:MAG: hypothetical protein JNK48_34690 [Bryobacterales bacterium]|nr:hypothetical protein [Bryobacterales bacterium]